MNFEEPGALAPEIWSASLRLGKPLPVAKVREILKNFEGTFKDDDDFPINAFLEFMIDYGQSEETNDLIYKLTLTRDPSRSRKPITAPTPNECTAKAALLPCFFNHEGTSKFEQEEVPSFSFRACVGCVEGYVEEGLNKEAVIHNGLEASKFMNVPGLTKGQMKVVEVLLLSAGRYTKHGKVEHFTYTEPSVLIYSTNGADLERVKEISRTWKQMRFFVEDFKNSQTLAFYSK